MSLTVVAERRPWRRALLALCMLGGALLLWSAPALARSQRGHEFGFAFGGPGSEAGQFSHPSGVAVNESLSEGNVYVLDAGNERIERLTCTTSSCTPFSSFKVSALLPEGIAIDNSGGPSNGDLYVTAETKEGLSVVRKFDPEGKLITSFKGEFKIKEEKEIVEEGELEEIHGVAVDASGDMYIYYGEGNVVKYDDAEKNVPHALFEAGEGIEECPSPGLAVGPAGEPLKGELLYAGRTLKNPVSEECDEELKEGLWQVVAKLNGEGEAEPEQPGNILGRENTSASAVDLASAEGRPLAARARGDVYLDNKTSVAVLDSNGAFIQRFGAGHIEDGAGLAIDSRSGAVFLADAKADKLVVFKPEEVPGAPSIDSLSATQSTDPTATTLTATIDPHGADTHYFFQYGTVNCAESPASCTTVPASPADLGSAFGDQTAEQPVHGLQPAATYYLRVVAESGAGKAERASTFTTLPSSIGLLPDGRAWEMVSPPEKDGANIEPIGGLVGPRGAPQGGVVQAAADGQAITYVADAPVEGKPEGNRAPEGTQVLSSRGGDAWSSQELATPHEQAGGILSGVPQEYRAFSADLALGLVQPFNLGKFQEPPLTPGVQTEQSGIYLRESTPIAPKESERASYEEAKRNGEAKARERAQAEGKPISQAEAEANPGFLPLVTGEDDTAGTEFGGKLESRGATSDLSNSVFESEVPLIAGAPPSPEPENPEELYEWSAASAPSERLKLVSVLPNGHAAESPQLGAGASGQDAVQEGPNAISSNGSRVFWNEEGDEVDHSWPRLYVRDTERGHEQTIQVNAAQGVKEVEKQEASMENELEPLVEFALASSDGSRVFFRDAAPLTSESTQFLQREEGPADLYVCDLPLGQPLECKLKDLTVTPGALFGQSAGVQGVLGASEDGSYVYFIANGVLAPGQHGEPGHCGAGQAQAKCYLYVAHFNKELGEHGEWESPRLIAAVSEEDSFDWRGRAGGNGGHTARVSPNGRYLAFMSDQPLTGYENKDASPEAKGARDEEVFLYDAHEDRLLCASCKPGGPPQGVLDPVSGKEGEGLLVDSQGSWHGRWLAASIPGWTAASAKIALYQSRYLTDEGRLFFNSPDQLASLPEGESFVHEENVYAYEPRGAGTCTSASATFNPTSGGCVGLLSSGTSDHESAFLDASENGNDVFFLTQQPLVAADHDENLDVYDAHVCSDASPCIKTRSTEHTSCEATPSVSSCRSGTFLPPEFGAPHIAGPEGGSMQANLGVKTESPTAAQRLAKALHACRSRWKRSKAKRVSCEARARKAYHLEIGLAACKRKWEKSKAKRVSCERRARRRYSRRAAGKRSRHARKHARK